MWSWTSRRGREMGRECRVRVLTAISAPLYWRCTLTSNRVEGKTYFKCRPLHAVFVRPEKVTIGDFPEEDLMADDDDEI